MTNAWVRFPEERKIMNYYDNDNENGFKGHKEDDDDNDDHFTYIDDDDQNDDGDHNDDDDDDLGRVLVREGAGLGSALIAPFLL